LLQVRVLWKGPQLQSDILQKGPGNTLHGSLGGKRGDCMYLVMALKELSPQPLSSQR